MALIAEQAIAITLQQEAERRLWRLRCSGSQLFRLA